MVRNFTSSNLRPPRPMRTWRKKIGKPEPSATAAPAMAMTGRGEDQSGHGHGNLDRARETPGPGVRTTHPLRQGLAAAAGVLVACSRATARTVSATWAISSGRIPGKSGRLTSRSQTLVAVGRSSGRHPNVSS